MPDYFSNQSSKSEAEPGAKTPLERQMQAAEFWMNLTGKVPEKETVPSEHDDPDVEYEEGEKEAAKAQVYPGPKPKKKGEMVIMGKGAVPTYKGGPIFREEGGPVGVETLWAPPRGGRIPQTQEEYDTHLLQVAKDLSKSEFSEKEHRRSLATAVGVLGAIPGFGLGALVGGIGARAPMLGGAGGALLGGGAGALYGRHISKRPSVQESAKRFVEEHREFGEHLERDPKFRRSLAQYMRELDQGTMRSITGKNASLRDFFKEATTVGEIADRGKPSEDESQLNEVIDQASAEQEQMAQQQAMAAEQEAVAAPKKKPAKKKEPKKDEDKKDPKGDVHVHVNLNGKGSEGKGSKPTEKKAEARTLSQKLVLPVLGSVGGGLGGGALGGLSAAYHAPKGEKARASLKGGLKGSAIGAGAGLAGAGAIEGAFALRPEHPVSILGTLAGTTGIPALGAALATHEGARTGLKMKERAAEKKASKASTRAISTGVGATLGALGMARHQFQRSKPRPGGKSREHLELESSIRGLEEREKNEGKLPPLSKLKKKYYEMRLAEATKLSPAQSAGIAALPGAVVGGALGYGAGRKLTP